MKKWRVGTVSMAISLILLGGILFISQIKGIEIFNMLLVWWPLIFIVLGIEILLYVYFSKQDTPLIKYDMLSILFVGFLGMISIGFVLLTSTGIMAEVQHVISAVERTEELPSVKKKIPSEVERVVVQTSRQPIYIEGTSEREVRLFGTYRIVTTSEGEGYLKQGQDILSTETIGDTMYITVKDLPQKRGMIDRNLQTSLTLVLPQELQVEIRGDHNHLELNPGVLKNDWLVQKSRIVNITLPAKSDILFSAVTQNETLRGNVTWDSLTKINPTGSSNDEQNPAHAPKPHPGEKRFNGTIKIGDGSYQLDVLDSYELTVNVR